MADSTLSTLICPNCGSNLHFDARSQAFPCGSCGSVTTFDQLEQSLPEEEESKIWDAVTASAESDASVREIEGESFDSDSMEGLSCPSCGAEVVTEKGTASSFCAFCGNHIVITEQLKADKKAPNRIIPFKITRERAEEEYRSMCKMKPFLPKAFKDKDRIKELKSVYVPFKLFSSSCYGNVSAICENVSTWSDSDYNYTQTDTYEVYRVGSIDYENVPFDSSEIMDDRIMDGLQPYDNSDLTDYSSLYLSGHAVANPDTPTEALLDRYKATAADGLISGLMSTMSYQSKRIKSQQASLGDVESEYVLLPVWTLATQHKDATYTFYVNGQTGKKNGTLPKSLTRILLWLAAVWGGATALLFIVQEVLIWLL